MRGFLLTLPFVGFALAACATTPASDSAADETVDRSGAAISAAGKGQTGCTTADLTNSSGHVIGSPRVHVVLWGFHRYGDASSEAAAAQNAFGTTVTRNSGIQGTRFWQGPAWQYTDPDLAPALSWFSSSPMFQPTVDVTYDDTGLPAGTCSLTETQIQGEVAYVNTHAIYPGGYKDPDDLVMVALPTCGTLDAGPGKHYFDATHGWAWGYVPYHPGNPQNFVKTISHEVIEAATNPYSLQVIGNGAYLPPVAGKNGWEQPGTSCEIGDLCELEEFGVQTQSLASGAPQYAQTTMQTMWSNELHDCVFSRSAYATMVGLGTDRQIYTESIYADTPADFAPGTFHYLAPPAGAAPFVGKPTVASWAIDNLDIAALDQNGAMWKAQSDDGGVTYRWDAALPPPAGGTAWFSTNDKGVSLPDAVSTGVGNFQVYAWALPFLTFPPSRSLLVRDAFDWGGAWTGWQVIATPVNPRSKISVASPMATPTGSTGAAIAVFLAYIDANGELELGVLEGRSTQPAWRAITLPISATPVSVDLAMSSPRRYDAIVLDSSGALWDCGTNANINATIQCSLAGATPSGGFVGTPGVAALGDGRLLMAGQVAGAGANAAFLRFVSAGQATAWNGRGSNNAPNGTLVAGLDVVGY